MRVYLVGGAVRDKLLGLPVRERDWVVTGATPAEMRAHGFIAVDGTFPVFRHPQTGDEHALARVEIKRGHGHRGFSFDCGSDITLEQDLARRDLTVNAMAEDQNGTLMDPFGGLAALRERRLVHVTPAFVDDPLRLLRAARFAACLAHLGFKIDAATLLLMKQIVDSGEHASLSRERVWRELELALRSPTPRVIFDVLRECGAAAAVLPALPPTSLQPDSQALRVLETVAAATEEVDVRLASLVVAGLEPLYGRSDAQSTARGLNAPGSAVRSVLRAASVAAALTRPQTDVAAYWLEAVEAGDGVRQVADFQRVLPVIDALFASHEGMRGVAEWLRIAQDAALGVDTAALAAQGLRGAEFGGALRAARLEAVARQLHG